MYTLNVTTGNFAKGGESRVFCGDRGQFGGRREQNVEKMNIFLSLGLLICKMGIFELGS